VIAIAKLLRYVFQVFQAFGGLHVILKVDSFTIKNLRHARRSAYRNLERFFGSARKRPHNMKCLRAVLTANFAARLTYFRFSSVWKGLTTVARTK